MTKPLQGTLRLDPEDRARILDMIEQAEAHLVGARAALAEEATADPDAYLISRYDGPTRLEHVRHRLRHCLRCTKSRVKRALLLLTAYEHGIEGNEGGKYGDAP